MAKRMNNGTNGIIEALLKRERAVKAALAAEKVRQQKRKEKEDARLASIIGTALMDVCAKQPESVGVMVRQILAASSLRESDRTFLAAKGFGA
jgi:phenylpyruvate tautomerase PptA (4-oxalocrotonate tautomerase family)